MSITDDIPFEEREKKFEERMKKVEELHERISKILKKNWNLVSDSPYSKISEDYVYNHHSAKALRFVSEGCTHYFLTLYLDHARTKCVGAKQNILTDGICAKMILHEAEKIYPSKKDWIVDELEDLMYHIEKERQEKNNEFLEEKENND